MASLDKILRQKFQPAITKNYHDNPFWLLLKDHDQRIEDLEAGGGGGGATAFTGLTDTPSSYVGSANKLVAVNGTGTALEFITSGAGISTFLGLTDSPASYAGQAGNGLKVNGLESALEYAMFVETVNGLSGPTVVMTTTNINEGTNLYYTEARVSANTDVAANTAARHTHANKALLDTITAANQLVSSGDRTNWDTAFGWGDHSAAGYLTDITAESIFDLSNVTNNSITNGEILVWRSGNNFVNETLAEAGISAVGHTHLEADITDLDKYDQAAIDAFFEGEDAGKKQVHWDRVTSKPATFTPSAHTHPHSDITDWDTELAGKTNVTAFTPTANYHPATKLYVDDEITGLSAIYMAIADYDSNADNIVDAADEVDGVASAGNSKYYGTNGSGTPGFYDLPGGVSSVNGDSGPAVVLDVSDINDVTITAIASGELLKWNGSAWINNTLSEAGIAAASHTHGIGDITNFQEEVEDIVGAMATDSATIDFTYNDGLGQLTAALTHLGIEDLVDPNADRIMFWDDSAGNMEWLTVGSGLSITGTTLTATGGSSHDLLSATHTDTVASAVTRGSIIIGNSTPAWEELVIGAANTVLLSDGTDVSWGKVDLANDVTGNLPVGNLNSGSGASASTFWRGDGTWASPAGGFANFDVGGDSGSDETVNSADLLDITGGTGIETTVSKASTTVTLDIDLSDTAVTPGTYGSATEYTTITVDQQGRLTAASEGNISIPLSQINDVTATAAELNLLDLSGLTAGWILRATGATTAAWGQLDHGDLGGLTDDDHTQYSIISSGASAPGSTPTRVGALYIDTTDDEAYIATGTGGSGDWDWFTMWNSGTNATWSDYTIDHDLDGVTSYADQSAWDASRIRVRDESNNDGNDHLLQVQRTLTNSSATGSYQKNGIMSSIRTADPSTFGSLDLDAVAIMGKAEIGGSNSTGRAWGINALPRIISGGDGFLVGVEVNVENNGTAVTTVNSGLPKIGMKVTNKAGTGTAALHISKGAGTGWYKGVIIDSDALVSNAATRAFELTDSFAVEIDGTVLVGKSTSDASTEGVEMGPTGTITATTDGQSSFTLRNDNTLAGAENIGNILYQGRSDAGTARNYVQWKGTASDPTDGAEYSTITASVYVNGSIVAPFSVGDGVVLGSPTGNFNGVGTLNAASDIYVNNQAVWHAGNDGAASGLDADLLDGQQGTYYLDLANHTGVLDETNGGTGQSTYATGDILYASASNTLSKLAAGTNGHVLTLAAGVPVWQAASGGFASFDVGGDVNADETVNSGDLLDIVGGSGIETTISKAATTVTLSAALDIDGLTADTAIGATDTIAIYDGANKKITFANFEGDLNHDNLAGFIANEHINHTSVSITAGTGLSGGGDISTNRTIDLDHLGIEDLTDPGADRIYFWDDSAGFTDWLIPGDALTITDKTIDFDINSLTEETTIDELADFVAFYDATTGDVRKTRLNKLLPSWTLLGNAGSSSTITMEFGSTSILMNGATGISVLTTDGIDTVTIDYDIDALTADGSPDGAADYVVTWDDSASAHKKVLLDDLPGGGISGLTVNGSGTYTNVVDGDVTVVETSGSDFQIELNRKSSLNVNTAFSLTEAENGQFIFASAPTADRVITLPDTSTLTKNVHYFIVPDSDVSGGFEYELSRSGSDTFNYFDVEGLVTGSTTYRFDNHFAVYHVWCDLDNAAFANKWIVVPIQAAHSTNWFNPGGASDGDSLVYNNATSVFESKRPRKTVQVAPVEWSTDVATGNGQHYFVIDSTIGGMDLVAVHAEVITAGTTGTTDIQIHNVTQATDMLSTKITIDSGETGSDTAATPPVIDTANDDVAQYDVIRIDVDAVSSTAPQGLIVTLEFEE